MGLWDIGLGIYVWDLSRCNFHGWLEGCFGPIWSPHLKKKEEEEEEESEIIVILFHYML